jgi:hypothetical protein
MLQFLSTFQESTMKSLQTAVAVALLLLLTGGATVTLADVFPSFIRITQDYSTAPFDGSFADGTGAAIRFILNQPADSVRLDVIPAAGGPAVYSVSKVGLPIGDNFINWNGMTTSGPADAGSYKFVVTAFHGGYATYTQTALITSPLAFIYTRGVTAITNPALDMFGFIYTVSRGGYVTGIARHTADGRQWGFKPDSAYLPNTGVPTPGTGNNISYAPTADLDGYVYIIKYDDHRIYRFHVDTMDVELYDSSAYGMRIQGLDVRGTGASKILYVTGDSAVWRIPIGTQTFNTQTPEMLVTVGTDTGVGLVFWDAKVGQDNSLYVIYRSTGAVGTLPAGSRGVLKFDLNTGSLPKTFADTVWTAQMADGDPVTLAVWDGTLADASDDILYMTHDVGGLKIESSGIYAITHLDAAQPTRTLAWLDPDNNTSSSRGTVTLDAVGNAIYFENSNEQVVLMSRPSGPNSYALTSKDSLTITAPGKVFPLVPIWYTRYDGNGDLLTDHRYDTVRVVGVINAVNIQTTQFGYFMQDDSAGIEIFKNTLVGAPTVKPGDRVMVKGFIDQYRGTVEITPQNLATDITILDTGNVITPIPITIAQYRANPEIYESRRIQFPVANPLGWGSAQWPAAGVAATLSYIWDGLPADTVQLRLDSDTEIPGSAYPTFPVQLTGIASQYTTASTKYNDGYQITPIFNADFVPVNAPPARFFPLLSPANGGSINVDTSSTSTYKFTWRAALDFNGDALVYQLVPIGFTATPSDNGAKDTVKTFTSAQLRTYIGTEDTLLLRWTVLTKDPTHTPVGSLDTFTVVLRKTFVGVDEESGIPKSFALSQNYPNPFNPTTTIRFALPTTASVTLRVYDLLGREVTTLVQDNRPAGYYNVVWSGKDNNGLSLASGVYFFRLEARPIDSGAPFTQLKKMILLK